MVYRKSCVAAILAILAISSAASAAPLAVVSGGRSSVERSELFRVRAELGDDRFLVELDDAAQTTAAAIGASLLPLENVDGPLYRIAGATPVEQALIPRAGRVVWSDGVQTILAPSREEDVWALGGAGVRLSKVPDHAMRPIASSASFTAGEYPVIDDIVATIHGTDVQAFDQDLQNFGTRHSNQTGGVNAQNYLVTKFQSFGLTQIDQASVPNITAKNVCATLPGTTTPEKVFVIGGHYDSTSTNTANAPGADDNGSGTAGVLAVAQALSSHQFESTLVFCGYAGEELGLLGSAVHAQALSAAGTDVAGMINLDMIGYLEPGDAMDIDVLSNTGSATMRSLFTDVVTRYVSGAAQVTGQIPAGASSDHASFWQEGFPALLLFEDTGSYTPYLHTAQDTVGTSFNSPALAEQITRSAAAMMAVMAVPHAGTTPTGTPTPEPTETPAVNPENGGTVHGSCACDLSAVDAAPSLLPALAALALAAVLRRRAKTN